MPADAFVKFVDSVIDRISEVEILQQRDEIPRRVTPVRECTCRMALAVEWIVTFSDKPIEHFVEYLAQRLNPSISLGPC